MKKLMMTFVVLFSLGTVMTTFTSCRDTNKSGIEKAADDVGDAVEDAADDVEDALN
ncbi:hypothetical protein [Gelidibacter japonicus]|jgi:hypothetical protein|uniref:hypothetical protein n=2 Tax=Gelidibacter japonicus TaxID=1962232 RepID=UPI001965F61D|nr:hypothetical protein [Gelidibacter japonicus]MCL8008879.1 hypothetical protein [Gelidibacter japonicus]